MFELYLGYILDLIFGDPYVMPHPVVYIGRAISNLEKVFRKLFKSEKALKYAGFLFTFIIVVGTYVIYFYILKVSRIVSPIFASILEVFMIYQIFATRCLANEGNKLYKTLKDGDLEESRKWISYLVSRDTETMNKEDIVKATIETISENIIDGIISPLFFIIIGGPPLAMAYKAANTLDSMVGYKNDKYYNFGYASAKFDDLLNYIPARLSSVLVVVSAFLLKLNYKASFKILIRDRNNHSSPNSAYSEAATAGALNIQLGGKASYFGHTEIKPTMGDYIETPAPKHIKDTIRIMYVSSILGMLLLSLRYLC
ncbi:MAG: adenosylcobinamide-phosphate synthase CbiB [Acidaminobacteraceae bacterium]